MFRQLTGINNEAKVTRTKANIFCNQQLGVKNVSGKKITRIETDLRLLHFKIQDQYSHRD